MDKILIISEIIFLLLGVASMYTPRVQLRRCPRLTGKELARQYPEHKWMRWGFISMYIAWIIAVFFFFFIALHWMNMISSMAALYACIGLFIGAFAVITGVSLFPVNSPRLFFVAGEEARASGRFQVAWSLGVLVIALAIDVLLKSLPG